MFKKVKFVIVLVIATITFISCSENNPTPEDTKHLKQFHETCFAKTNSLIKENDLRLFVDYSTCIKLGQHSDFFKELRSSLQEKTKHYYSIKGNNIIEENTEDTSVYDRLRNISEFNYANLRAAADSIANGNSEAVLLTDGEFIQKGIAEGNETNPYMAGAFKKWLKKGGDIYILIEPYEELHKGEKYNKKRFYFIFTDNHLEDNIYKNIKEYLKKFDYIKEFHLSANNPVNAIEVKSLDVNPTLSAISKPYGNYEIQDWQIDWEAIEGIIMGAVDPKTGESLPNGECVIGGLQVDKNHFGGYKISEIDVKVYNINYAYFEYYNQNNKKTFKAPELDLAQNAFIFDKEKFNKKGIIDLYFDVNMWNPDFLDGDLFNYTKIDICISNVDNAFDKSKEKEFYFDLLGEPGKTNKSVAESIKQCLLDSEIEKMMESIVLYSIYIKSNKY
jgi:hypothetical protein